MEMKNIAQLLQSFRSDLPDGSKTAAAIDRNAFNGRFSRGGSRGFAAGFCGRGRRAFRG